MIPDIAEIARALRLYHPDPDSTFEIRALKVENGGTASGYFRAAQIDAAAQAAAALSGNCKGVYLTLNPVDAEVLNGRAAGRIDRSAKVTTKDKEVTRLTKLLIDFDPERQPADISATDKEKVAAFALAERVKAELFPGIEPIVVDSGNGAQLIYKIDEPNDPATVKLLRRVLAAVKARFSTAQTKIDVSVFNPSRIVRLPGTLNCKGDNTSDRPHRMARIISVPAAMLAVSRAILELVAGPEPHRGPAATRLMWTDVKPVFEKRITKTKPGDNGATIVEVEGCPFGDEHSDDRSGFFVVEANGQAWPHCQHDHCRPKSVSEFLSAHPELQPTEGRAIIILRPSKLPEDIDQVENILVANAARLKLFQRAGRVMKVIVLDDDPRRLDKHNLRRRPGTAQLQAVSVVALQDTLDREICFLKFPRRKENE